MKKKLQLLLLSSALIASSAQAFICGIDNEIKITASKGCETFSETMFRELIDNSSKELELKTSDKKDLQIFVCASYLTGIKETIVDGRAVDEDCYNSSMDNSISAFFSIKVHTDKQGEEYSTGNYQTLSIGEWHKMIKKGVNACVQ